MTTSTKLSSGMEGAPVSPSGSTSDANHNLNKPLLTSSSSSSSFTNNKGSGSIRDDVVASDFLSGRPSSPTPLHVTADRPEDDVEEAELATEPEEVDEEEEVEEEEDDATSPEAHLRDVTQRIKYLHQIESIRSHKTAAVDDILLKHFPFFPFHFNLREVWWSNETLMDRYRDPHRFSRDNPSSGAARNHRPPWRELLPRTTRTAAKQVRIFFLFFLRIFPISLLAPSIMSCDSCVSLLPRSFDLTQLAMRTDKFPFEKSLIPFSKKERKTVERCRRIGTLTCRRSLFYGGVKMARRAGQEEEQQKRRKANDTKRWQKKRK